MEEKSVRHRMTPHCKHDGFSNVPRQLSQSTYYGIRWQQQQQQQQKKQKIICFYYMNENKWQRGARSSASISPNANAGGKENETETGI